MSDRTEQYRKEILAWLLGRLSRRRRGGAIAPRTASLSGSPALAWWVLEGRRYRGLEGPLWRHWHWIERQARRLLRTYNPVWRPVEAPEGETDWIATAFQSLTSGRRTFVSKASRSGLQREELRALLGWLEWIRSEWDAHVEHLGPPEGSNGEPVPWPARPDRSPGGDVATFRRWARTAKRSRWPLLREIVAETLRCMLEPIPVRRIPLPSKPDRLFELVCLVRILKAFEPEPKRLRWLDLQAEKRRIRVPGFDCHDQKSLSRKRVLGSGAFSPGLREALEHYRLRVPGSADGWVVFDEPRGGFAGILVEMKSGSQTPDVAVHQLRCYRAALVEEIEGPVVVWGIVEKAWLEQAGSDQERPENTASRAPRGVAEIELPAADPETGDQWVFSTAEQIPAVLGGLGLIDPEESRAAAAGTWGRFRRGGR